MQISFNDSRQVCFTLETVRQQHRTVDQPHLLESNILLGKNSPCLFALIRIRKDLHQRNKLLFSFEITKSLFEK